ncbi:uncharacterized protein LOC114532096 [Dendronephthya gigantea]|uniref:uncharacterized protein LOC114532096 n=1 Tax=Dendronephthya gigantea TaxID=151771 RepID=UPI00106C6455|nr:uncharacterized protein LOC114532096 [Dendronephthya gigantea]
MVLNAQRAKVIPKLSYVTVQAWHIERTYVQLYTSHQCTTTTAQSGHGSRHSNRVFVKSKDTRKSLKRVCTDVSAIDINELNALQSELHQSIPSLANFLDWCLAIYGNEAAFPIGISKFIKDISCNTPICAILPLDEELRRVCDKIKRSVPVKEFPSDMELLQRKCPALFGIFSSLSDSFAPAEFIPLLTDLLNIADNAFKDREAPQDDSVVNPSSLLANFPSLKPVRGRGTYAADKGKQTFENPCTKKSGRHPTLLPGIFLIFCQHGINYGYSVMTTNESPDMPFTILRSRFTRGNTVNV